MTGIRKCETPLLEEGCTLAGSSANRKLSPFTRAALKCFDRSGSSLLALQRVERRRSADAYDDGSGERIDADRYLSDALPADDERHGSSEGRGGNESALGERVLRHELDGDVERDGV